MATLQTSTFTFLKNLQKNNNRNWFAENKPKYETAKADFQNFFKSVKKELEKHDEIEATKIYRIYRDVRFSKDKTPYKKSMSGFFTRATKWKRGGYYFHFQPGGNSFAGGGFWMPNKEDILRIRQEIEMDDKPFRKVFNNPSFKKTFGQIGGEQLKTAPRGFPKDHAAVDLLRHKSFICSHKFTDKEMKDEKASKIVSDVFKKMLPFFDLFSQVLTTNLNGEQI